MQLTVFLHTSPSIMSSSPFVCDAYLAAHRTCTMSSATLQEKRRHIYADLVRLHQKLEYANGPSCPRYLLKDMRIDDVLVNAPSTSLPEFSPTFFLPPQEGFHLETPYPRSAHTAQCYDEEDDTAPPLRYPLLLHRADNQLADTVVPRWPAVAGFASFRNDWYVLLSLLSLPPPSSSR